MQIQKVPQIPVLPKKKRVAAYCRVSTGKDAMLHSLSAQVSYYNKLIQSHADWLYCGVYADEGISGTKNDRAEYQRMLADCREGKLDLLLTKSISRFARNTVTLLETVRELKALHVDVYFEEQKIHSISAEGELIERPPGAGQISKKCISSRRAGALCSNSHKFFSEISF